MITQANKQPSADDAFPEDQDPVRLCISAEISGTHVTSRRIWSLPSLCFSTDKPLSSKFQKHTCLSGRVRTWPAWRSVLPPRFLLYHMLQRPTPLPNRAIRFHFTIFLIDPPSVYPHARRPRVVISSLQFRGATNFSQNALTSLHFFPCETQMRLGM